MAMNINNQSSAAHGISSTSAYGGHHGVAPYPSGSHTHASSFTRAAAAFPYYATNGSSSSGESVNAQGSNAPWTLNVFCLGAYDLPNKDHFKSHDPYLCVSVGNRTKQTGVHSRGGSHPTWNQCLTFRVSESQLDLESLHLECYDFDYFTKDDLIGVGGCSLREAKHGFDGWIELVKKCNRKAGRVHIRMTLDPPERVQLAPSALAEAHAEDHARGEWAGEWNFDDLQHGQTLYLPPSPVGTNASREPGELQQRRRKSLTSLWRSMTSA